MDLKSGFGQRALGLLPSCIFLKEKLLSEIDELRSSMRLQPLREVNDAEEMQGVGVKPGYRKNGCYSTSNAELLFKQISELSQFLLLPR